MDGQLLESLFCPICYGLITDPVTIETGHSYCREHITQWFAHNNTCPVTNMQVSPDRLVPNHTLKKIIEEYQEKHCKLIPRSAIELHEQIGRGSFKVVHRATMRLLNQPKPQQVAALIVQSGDVSTEISNLLKLAQHPNLVTFIGQCDPQSSTISERILITEFANRGSLDTVVSDLDDNGISLSLEHKTHILLHIARGMEALGHQHLVHRDLALRNILVFALDTADASKITVKVSDFGLTLDTYSHSYRYVEGGARPLRWLAPEVLKKNKYSTKSDVWAFGVLAYELLSDGSVPYAEVNEDCVRKHILDGNILQRPPECEGSFTPLWTLACACFETFPVKRPTFTEIICQLAQQPNSSTSSISVNEHTDPKPTLEEQQSIQHHAAPTAADSKLQEEEDKMRQYLKIHLGLSDTDINTKVSSVKEVPSMYLNNKVCGRLANAIVEASAKPPAQKPPKSVFKGKCNNCGKKGHQARDCSEPKSEFLVNREASLAVKSFDRILKNETEYISSLDDAKLFVKGLMEYAASNTAEMLWRMAKPSGRKRLSEALSFGAGDAYTTLTLAVLRLLDDKRLQKPTYTTSTNSLYLTVYKTPGLLTEMTNHAGDTADLICSFAITVAKLLPEARDDILLKNLETKLATRTLCCKQVDRLSRLLRPNKYRAAGRISKEIERPGGRHDNDHEDYRRIALIPTPAELTAPSAKPPYLPLEADANRFLEDDQAHLLDKQFRLLREDLVDPLKQKLTEALEKQTDLLHSAQFVDADLVPKACIYLRFQVPKKMSKVKTEEGFWDDSRLLQYGTVVGLFQEKFDPLFGRVADRDSKRLAKDQTIGLIFEDQHLSKALRWIKDASKSSMVLVEISASFFSYEPILKCLQQMSFVPFAHEIVHMKPSQPIKYVEPAAIQTAFETEVRKLPFELDTSQRKAMETALNDRVSLIQGPPGTGKSFIGNLIAKVLLQATGATGEKILCVCYTNHALDQFLEAMIDSGMHDIVRLGTASKSEVVKEYELRSLTEKVSHDPETKKQWYLIKKEMGELEATFDEFKGFMAMDDLIWRRADEYLKAKYPELHSQFAMPTNLRPGFKIIGPSGKELTQNDIWHRWKNGGEPYPGMGRGTLWELSHSKRIQKFRAWLAEIKQAEADKCATKMKRHKVLAKMKNEIRHLDDRRILEKARVIGCTTHGAASRKEMLQLTGAKILIVEEAAEVLEAHVLTSIGSTIEHIIMIGDHKQLRPKADCYKLRIEAGKGYDLNRSLFERMVKGGFSFSTLTKQHRMRPEISSLVRTLTYPNLVDGQDVKFLPPLKGVDRNVIFIDHRHLEAQLVVQKTTLATEGNSKVNDFEAQMCARMAKYFLQQGYKPSQIVLLATYKDQLKLFEKYLSECKLETILSDLDLKELEKDNDYVNVTVSKSDSEIGPPIKVATVDNYQGEEADIIIASFVRSNKEGIVGHLNEPQRINVLLSRARHGLVLIGNKQTLLGRASSSDPNKMQWHTFYKQLQCVSTVSIGFPAKCQQHPAKGTRLLEAPHHFDAQCPDGGCTETCGHVLKCGHKCPKKCHPLIDGQHDSIGYRCKAQTVHTCTKCGIPSEVECWRVQKSEFEPCAGCIKIERIQQLEFNKDLRQKIKKAENNAKERPFRKEIKKKGATLQEWNSVADRVENYMQMEHGLISVTRIERLHNRKLELAWLKARLEMIDCRQDPTDLFHGTSAEATDSIAEDGFRLPAKGEGNMFGRGIYLATDSTKSANPLYTKGSSRLLICETLLGKSCTIEGWSKHFPLSKHIRRSNSGSNKGLNYLDVDLKSVRSAGFDSVYAPRDCHKAGGVKYDEMIAYDERLVLPKYIVHFRSGSAFKKHSLEPGIVHKLKPKRSFDPDDPLEAHYRMAESQFRRMLENHRGKSTITQIDVFIDQKLYTTFQKKKSEYDLKFGKGHETRLAFHGTKAESIDAIMRDGFKLAKVGSATDAGWYGAGIYFSEKTAYSQAYDKAGGKLLLSRLLIGKPYKLTHGQRCDGEPLKQGFTSHVVNDGDEVVMFDMDAILPMYVVHYE